MCLFNVISVITTSSNHTRLVDFSASLLESPFALMKACCQLAETLVSFLLLQQLNEDFYYLQRGFRSGKCSLLWVKPSKDRLCKFPTLFLVQYQISMHDQWCSSAGAPLRHLYQCIGRCLQMGPLYKQKAGSLYLWVPAPVKVPESIKLPLHPWAWTMNLVLSELAEYSKERLFRLSDFYQQFCGQVT